MNILQTVRPWLWPLGYDIVPFNVAEHPLARRRRLLEFHRIDTVLDVGANTGQFGRQLRRDLRYRGNIVSFEPLSAAFAGLQRRAAGDSRWQVLNCALGDAPATRTIHVAGNSESSSLLDMLPRHVQAAPHTAYVAEESIRVETLDDLFERVCGDARNVYLKIDTQGYEQQVLRGAERSLRRIGTIQLELSLVPLYRGQALFPELYAALAERGYTMVALENAFGDGQTGQLLQVDAIFHRFPDAQAAAGA
jgi:FkbM family methyltransferase